MKTLAVTQLRQITGGKRAKFYSEQNPFIIIGPMIFDPVLPNDEPLVIPQEIASLTGTNFVAF